MNYENLCRSIKEDYDLLKKEQIIRLQLCDGLLIEIYVKRVPHFLTDIDTTNILNTYSNEKPICKLESKCQSCFFDSVGRNVTNLSEIFSNDYHNVIVRKDGDVVGVFVLTCDSLKHFTIWNVCRINSPVLYKGALQKAIVGLVNSTYYKDFHFSLKVLENNPARNKYKKIGFEEIYSENGFVLMKFVRQTT